MRGMSPIGERSPEPDFTWRRGTLPRSSKSSIPHTTKRPRGCSAAKSRCSPTYNCGTWPALETRGDYFLNRYALPVTHVVQFHPENKALRSPAALRRALVYATQPPAHSRPAATSVVRPDRRLGTDLPPRRFPQVGYAYNTHDTTASFRPRACRRLGRRREKRTRRKAARTQIAVPARSSRECRRTREMIAQWARIGVKVTLITKSHRRLSPDDTPARMGSRLSQSLDV